MSKTPEHHERWHTFPCFLELWPEAFILQCCSASLAMSDTNFWEASEIKRMLKKTCMASDNVWHKPSGGQHDQLHAEIDKYSTTSSVWHKLLEASEIKPMLAQVQHHSVDGNVWCKRLEGEQDHWLVVRLEHQHFGTHLLCLKPLELSWISDCKNINNWMRSCSTIQSNE